VPKVEVLLKRFSLLFRGVVGVLLVVGAIGLLGLLVQSKRAPQKAQQREPVPFVSTVTLKRVSIPRVWDGFGTARAMDAADVSAQVSGKVVERPSKIEPGAQVEQGDLLVRLEQVDFQQRVASAKQLVASFNADLEAIALESVRLEEQVELAEAEARIRRNDYDREIQALEAGAGSTTAVEERLATLQRAQRELAVIQQQLDLIKPRRARLQAQLESAEADLRLAEENLKRSTINAPLSGVLQDVMVEEGELLPVGGQVARIVDLSRIEVPLRLPVSAASELSLGDVAELRTDSLRSPQWMGRVARIAPEADESTRMTTVFVEVDQEPAALAQLEEAPPVLQPGRFLVGRVTSSSKASRLIVPRRGVVGDRVAVARLRGDGFVVEFVDVHVAFHTDGLFPEIDPRETQWAVLSDPRSGAPGGLNEGDRLIVSGREDLVVGQSVIVGDAPGEVGSAVPTGRLTGQAAPGGGDGQ